MDKKQSDRTLAAHAGGPGGLVGKTVSAPIQRGSTVILPNAASLYDTGQVTYGRAGLQPHATLCQALCDLEGADSCWLFPSGLAAMTAAITAFVSAGDEVLAADCIYFPTRRYCDQVLARFGVATRYFDPALSAADLAAQVTDRTRVIVLEAPGSLLYEMQDLASIAAMARAKGIVTIIDNTWAAGLLYKPIAHGIDVSVQALTKYVGGHSDSFMGSACAATPAIGAKLKDITWQVGWSTGPEDAWLMLRGLRTLPTRMERHGQNALAIAAWLKDQPDVAEVICPGLPGSRGHDIWRRDFSGQNGLVSFVLKPRPRKAVEAMLDAQKLFALGFSWGGYESLAIHCDAQLPQRHFPPNVDGPLIRLHVGLEDVEDLKADLAAGLVAYAGG